MAGKDQYKAKTFIDAIPGTGGVISQIAGKVGCTWQTAQKYIETYPTVNAVYKAEKERMLDNAESALFESIEDREAWAVKYLLSTKGRDRGYGERLELAGDPNAPVIIKVVRGGTDG